MFYEKIFDANGTDLKGQENHLIPHENELSKSFFNCMNELDRPLTLEEIGEIYCVSGRMTIWRIANNALKHLKNKAKPLREYYVK
jgi:DNA-directed RNA polymerase sigma subunit (sigma70/sigma32)